MGSLPPTALKQKGNGNSCCWANQAQLLPVALVINWLVGPDLDNLAQKNNWLVYVIVLQIWTIWCTNIKVKHVYTLQHES